MRTTFASALAGGLLARSVAAQAVMGFNSGSTYNDGTIKTIDDFTREFTTGANLEGAPGTFNSVRLYTMVQGGTTSDPISAFQAAINTNTTMLLGIWCSGTTTNKPVLDAIDFLGTDAYPYFQSNKGNNSIENAVNLWTEALEASQAAANGKPVWITETGWPTSGETWGMGVPSVENAKRFWDEVGCTLFGKINTWWYILRDSNPANTALFAITDNLSTTPKFNLTCPAVKPSASSSASAGAASSTGSVTGGSSAQPATGAEDAADPASASGSASPAASGNGAGALAPSSVIAALVLAAAATFML